MSKVFVFGIDGAFPEYIFGEWKNELPTLNKLMQQGIYAKLNSSVPCLSVTAWSSILTGKPPAETGIFEYMQRKNNSYYNWNVITSNNLKEKTLWKVAGEHNKKSIICNILLTWPIKPLDGIMITGPLTPIGSKYIYPEGLESELNNVFEKIPPVDIPNFRSLSKEEIAEAITKHTQKQIEMMLYLCKNKPWDFFFAMVPMSDRMNHTFWRYMDPLHRKYDPASPLKDTLKKFYQYLDKKLEEFLLLLDEDTRVIVLSDHGIMRMHTRVNLTDWLMQNGYMVLKEPVKEKKEFNFEMVDWSRTKAFAIGAYEGQVFLNLKDREPEGIVEENEYGGLIDELIEKLGKITGDDGKKLDTRFFKKKECFIGKKDEHAPDLMIYFDDLQYGCNNTLIGNETLWSPQTAKGSDDAGHSKQGIFIMNDGKHEQGDIGEVSYLDVAPTVLNLMDIPVPEDMKGKIIGTL